MATDNVSSQVTIGQPHLAKQDLSKLVNITFLWQLVRSRVYDQNGRSLTVLKLMIIFFILLYQDATELNPLTPEVISRQATINIGQYTTARVVYRRCVISVNLSPSAVLSVLLRLWECIFSGTIGHVAHGKSTVVKALSGVQVTVLNLSAV